MAPIAGRDLLVRVALQGAAHERLPLGLRQSVDGLDRPIELVLREDDLGRLCNAVEVVGKLLVHAAVAARVQRPVADDRVEPGFQVHVSGRVAQRAPRAHEALLDHVLGIRGPVGGGEGDQRRAIPAHDLLERGLAALPRKCDQPVIRLRVEDRSGERLQAGSLRHRLVFHYP